MENQFIVPSSFIELYTTPGRIRPNASPEEIAARYELCEDLATVLTERARAVLWETGAAEADVMERMYRGLLGADSVVSEPEAGWVVRRLTELLGWEPNAPRAPGA
jgi:hypothetical protein